MINAVRSRFHSFKRIEFWLRLLPFPLSNFLKDAAAKLRPHWLRRVLTGARTGAGSCIDKLYHWTRVLHSCIAQGWLNESVGLWSKADTKAKSAGRLLSRGSCVTNRALIDLDIGTGPWRIRHFQGLACEEQVRRCSVIKKVTFEAPLSAHEDLFGILGCPIK